MSESAPRSFILVTMGGALCGIETTSVREIVPFRQVTRLPGAPDHVSGVMNLRGTLVTVVDLRSRLGTASEGSDPSVVLVNEGTRLLGYLVDDVHDVYAAEPQEIEPPPPTAVEGIVAGLGHFADSVVILLDARGIAERTLG